MEKVSTYHVITNGQLIDGFEPEAVQQAFSQLFKIPLDKAKRVVGTKTTIKKDLDLKTAHVYKQRLEGIGLGIQLKEQKPEAKATMTLALEPMDGDSNDENSEPNSQAAVSTRMELVETESASYGRQESNQPSTTMRCPKCDFEQPKSEQCQGCGVFFNKLQSPVIGAEPVNTGRQEDESAPIQLAVLGTTPELDIKSFGAACGAALVGALLWKFIAVTFEYEFGMIAWLVGGMVGFSAAFMGAHGEKAAGLCAVLTILAILSGKYMAFESIKDDINQLIGEQMDQESLQEIYEEELFAAQQFQEQVVDEQSKRQFMVDFGYSESFEAESVTSEELHFFNEYEVPALEDIALYEPPFDEWKNVYLVGKVNNISTLDLIKEDFGFLDALFIFFGVSTAFQLVYRKGV